MVAIDKKYTPRNADNSGPQNPTVAWQGWQGYQFDQPLGLQYLRQRWYDPKTRQFISPDPLGFAGGDANLFRYAGNNPVNRNDPGGMAGTPIQPASQLTRITGIEDTNAIKTESLLEEYYALQLAASQLFPVGAFHLPWPSPLNRIAQAIQASVARLTPPSMFGPMVPYKPGEALSLWQQQLMHARHGFANELNITEFELYQTLEAEGRTKAANRYAAAMAGAIYGDITLSTHPSRFLMGRYRFWEGLLQSREEIRDFFRRFPNATYGPWPHGENIFSSNNPPQAQYVYKPKAIAIFRPVSALAEQLLLAGIFSKSTSGAKPLEGHGESDLGPDTDGNERKAPALVSGGVSLIRPAAEVINQFLRAPGEVTVYFWATKHQAGYYSSAGSRLTKDFLHRWAGIPLEDLK